MPAEPPPPAAAAAAASIEAGGWARRCWTAAFVAVAAVALAMAAWFGASILLLAFAAVLLAVLLGLLRDGVRRATRLGPRLSLTIVLVVLLAAATGIGFWVAPALADQFDELQERLDESVRKIEGWFDRNAEALPVEDLSEVPEEVSDGGIWSPVMGLFSGTLSAVGAFLLVLLLAAFLAYDPPLYLGGVLRLVPRQRRRRVAEILAAIGTALRWWMAGQVVSMVILSVSVWLVLWLLDIPLAFIIAIITAILTFVPYLGPVLAMVPPVLVALMEGPTTAVTVFLVLLVVQNVEGNVITPLIHQRAVRVPAALVLVAQVLLGTLFGVLGFVLATPLTASVLVAVKHGFVRDWLGDDMQEPVKELEVFAHLPGRKAL